MNFFKKINAFFNSNKSQAIDFQDFQKYGAYASYFFHPIAQKFNGQMSPFAWVYKESLFASCYMIGFASVLAEAETNECVQTYTLNIAFQIFKELFENDEVQAQGNAKIKVAEAFYQFLFTVDFLDDIEAFRLGQKDGWNVVNQHSQDLVCLMSHFIAK